jgi:hypothetical protein
MTAQEIVGRYYDAWQTKSGDLTGVPLADDFQFSGPVASFDSADGYRGMAREAGRAVTSFSVRKQFVDGNTVCSIIDWEMAIPGVGQMTSAELLEVRRAPRRARRESRLVVGRLRGGSGLFSVGSWSFDCSAPLKSWAMAAPLLRSGRGGSVRCWGC